MRVAVCADELQALFDEGEASLSLMKQLQLCGLTVFIAGNGYRLVDSLGHAGLYLRHKMRSVSVQPITNRTELELMPLLARRLEAHRRLSSDAQRCAADGQTGHSPLPSHRRRAAVYTEGHESGAAAGCRHDAAS